MPHHSSPQFCCLSLIAPKPGRRPVSSFMPHMNTSLYHYNDGLSSPRAGRHNISPPIACRFPIPPPFGLFAMRNLHDTYSRLGQQIDRRLRVIWQRSRCTGSNGPSSYHPGQINEKTERCNCFIVPSRIRPHHRRANTWHHEPRPSSITGMDW